MGLVACLQSIECVATSYCFFFCFRKVNELQEALTESKISSQVSAYTYVDLYKKKIALQ